MDKVLALTRSKGRKETQTALYKIEAEEIDNELDSFYLVRMELEKYPDIESGEAARERGRDGISEAQQVEYFCQTVIETM